MIGYSIPGACGAGFVSGGIDASDPDFFVAPQAVAVQVLSTAGLNLPILVQAGSTYRDIEFQLMDGSTPLPLYNCIVSIRMRNVLLTSVQVRVGAVVGESQGKVLLSRDPDPFPNMAEMNLQFVVNYPNGRTLRVPENGSLRLSVRRAI